MHPVQTPPPPLQSLYHHAPLWHCNSATCSSSCTITPSQALPSNPNTASRHLHPLHRRQPLGPWQGPTSATPPTGPQPCFSPRTFTQPPEAKPAFTAGQQPCPRLDGSFLAECIKPPTPLPCVVNSCNQSVQLSSPLANQAQFSTTHAPMAGALPVLGNPDTEPTTGMAAPALSFSSLPSTSSCLSVAPKAELAPGDGPYDCFGTSRHLYRFDHVCAACTKMSKCSCMLVLVCLQSKRHKWHTCSNCAHGQTVACMQQCMLALLCSSANCIYYPLV